MHNFLEEEKAVRLKRKQKKGRQFVSVAVTHRSTLSLKLRCGTKGCKNQAVTFRGKKPDCGQHE